jgi:uncharacterized protein (DUF1015 family)
MPEIRPFRAIRYDYRRFNADLSAVLAPPYDVLDQAEKVAMLAKNSRNIVAIDLPHIPPKDEGPQEAYAGAKATMDTWMTQGVLVREPKPAIYLYHQTFEHEGREVTRHQMIVTMRLHDFGEGIVLPHEQTFGGPKADRLALTKATRCNLSPVFGLFTDPEGMVEKAFGGAAKQKPDATGVVEGVKNAVWIVTDAEIINKVSAALASNKVFIADGHHRYTTALNYRDQLAQSQGELPQDHPANYVMIVLASMDDPGCVIQGYCRVLIGTGVSADALAAAWSEGAADSHEREADVALYDGPPAHTLHLKFTNRDVMDELAPERHPSWRALDVVYLHTYLIDKLAADRFGTPPEVRYVKSQKAARTMAEQTGAVAVIPNPTPMAELRAVSEAGELMPQKSTFFYPKLATGFTIHPLYTEEGQ